MSDVAEEHLNFLMYHQPMPSDWDITDAEGDCFAGALEYFETHQDDRCVPLFINAVSASTGLGMYEHIKFVLMHQSRSVVVENLRKALESKNAAVIYRSCWWAVDLQASELAEVISGLVHHVDDEVRIAARVFLEWYNERESAA